MHKAKLLMGSKDSAKTGFNLPTMAVELMQRKN
jgi:hypothetical protein